tara:strand:+ start:181 stop:777 length:597 start_codon:yes stop_codon:yes gene_type:complete
MIFNYNSRINFHRLLNLINIKKLEILDFGCGRGIWLEKALKNKKLNKIVLYDENIKLIPILKKKYSSRKIKINFNLKNILEKEDFNLIIFSSVIQYMKKDYLEKLIRNLVKNKKKLFIVITDIPFLPRPFELLLMPFLNLKRFLYVLQFIFLKDYKKLNYQTYKKDDFKFLKNKFKLKFTSNFHDLDYLRYSLILELK